MLNECKFNTFSAVKMVLHLVRANYDLLRTWNSKFRTLDLIRDLPVLVLDLTQDLTAKTGDLLVTCKTSYKSHLCHW